MMICHSFLLEGSEKKRDWAICLKKRNLLFKFIIVEADCNLVNSLWLFIEVHISLAEYSLKNQCSLESHCVLELILSFEIEQQGGMVARRSY
jgi:hypothetical protein